MFVFDQHFFQIIFQLIEDISCTTVKPAGFNLLPYTNYLDNTTRNTNFNTLDLSSINSYKNSRLKLTISIL